MLEGLPAEQQAIAQQLLRGGIPAVRTALHFERERAREEGRPEPSTEGVLSIAESLASRVKAAEWRDRAEAALKGADDLAMRDLRSLVSSSDVAREEASRELVVALREMLEHRVEAHRTGWVTEVSKHLDDGHVLRALRLSARPPDPTARFSAELATRLRDAASAALSPSAPSDKWLALLQAVVDSPVRRTVKPEGLPPNATPELLEVARQQCGRVPALAPLLGLSVPPPPGPARPLSPTRPPAQHAPRRPKPSRPTAPAPRAPKALSGEERAAEPAVGEPDAVQEVAVAAEPATEVIEPVAETTMAEPARSEGQTLLTVPAAEAVRAADAVPAADEAKVDQAKVDEAKVDEAKVAGPEPVSVEVGLVAEVAEPIAAEAAAEMAEPKGSISETGDGGAVAEPAACVAEPDGDVAEPIAGPSLARADEPAVDGAADAVEPEVDGVHVAPEPPEEVSAAPAGH